MKDAGAIKPIFIAAMTATRIDDIAQKLYRDKPAGIAPGFAIASAIDSTAPFLNSSARCSKVSRRKSLPYSKPQKATLIVSGIGCQSQAIIAAAANVATAGALRIGMVLHQPTNLFYCLPRCTAWVWINGFRLKMRGLETGGRKGLN